MAKKFIIKNNPVAFIEQKKYTAPEKRLKIDAIFLISKIFFTIKTPLLP